MRLLTIFLFSFLLCSLSGCVSGNFDYLPPSKTAYKDKKSQVILEAPVGKVWSQFLKEVNTSGYQVEEVDISKHIINLSVTPLNSCNYIDCGEFFSYIKDPLHESREYLYKGCTDSVSYERENCGKVMTLSRHANLTIQSKISFNAYNEKTIVVISSNYLFEKNYLFSKSTGELLRKTNTEIAFTNKTIGDDTYGNEFGSICISTGHFEASLIDMIKGGYKEGQY